MQELKRKFQRLAARTNEGIGEHKTLVAVGVFVFTVGAILL